MDDLMKKLKEQILGKQAVEEVKLKEIEKELEEEKNKLVFFEPSKEFIKASLVKVPEQKAIDEMIVEEKFVPETPLFFEASKKEKVEGVLTELQVEEIKERLAARLKPLEEELNELALLKQKEEEEKKIRETELMARGVEAKAIGTALDVEKIWQRIKKAERKEAEKIAERIDMECIFARLKVEEKKIAERIAERIERHERELRKRREKKLKRLGLSEKEKELVKTVEKEEKKKVGELVKEKITEDKLALFVKALEKLGA